jgi:superfamily II DNA or RNA helicase
MPDTWSDVDLRPYQEAALSAWELAHRRGVVALPTGSGKTRLALAAMQRTRLSALCLVPTRVLLDQWSREIGAVYRGTVGCYGDGVRQLTPLTVATFESAYRHMDQLGARFDLLIVDEVHHFGGGLRDEALEMTIAAARLGLTATPPRAPGAVARLADLVGPTVFELAVADLAGGFLASFDAITLYLDLSPEERSAYASLSAVFNVAYREFRHAAPAANWADFTQHSGRTPAGRRALAAWRQMRRLLAFTHSKRRALRSLLERHRHSRVLVFTADNETAYAIARDHLVMPLTCDIGRQERDETPASMVARSASSFLCLRGVHASGCRQTVSWLDATSPWNSGRATPSSRPAPPANTTAASRNASPGSSGGLRRTGMWSASRSR